MVYAFPNRLVSYKAKESDMATVEEKLGHELNTKKLRVLIADDDAPTRILLRAAISQWGYEVIEAKDGEEAWNMLNQPEQPKLLILDWLMPKLDGITVCERARKELNFHPYIILLTQVTGTTNIIKGLEAGADEFLSKPFNMAELRSRLSTGARLINYKLQVKEQYDELQSYLLKMQSLCSPALEDVQQLYNSIAQSGADVTTIKSLQNKIENMVTVLKNFQVESEKRS